MALVDRVDLFRLPDLSQFRPFRVGRERLGWIGHRFAERLAAYPKVFEVGAREVRLAADLDNFARRTEAVGEVTAELAKAGIFPKFRNELYPVGSSFLDDPALALERSTVPAFGSLAFGVHLNGFVGRGREMKMWIARRSRHKATGALKLDHVVAGGQPMGISLQDNLVKECAEEAAMPAALARCAWPTGFVSYLIENWEGIRNDIIYCYDLELPPDFEPRNTDGEVEAFYLWPIDEVIETLAETEEFKFNVALVIVDFLVRHGLIQPDDPDYAEIVGNLRIRDHFPEV